jgi:hypothetical protein
MKKFGRYLNVPVRYCPASMNLPPSVVNYVRRGGMLNQKIHNYSRKLKSKLNNKIMNLTEYSAEKINTIS